MHQDMYRWLPMRVPAALRKRTTKWRYLVEIWLWLCTVHWSKSQSVTVSSSSFNYVGEELATSMDIQQSKWLVVAPSPVVLAVETTESGISSTHSITLPSKVLMNSLEVEAPLSEMPFTETNLEIISGRATATEILPSEIFHTRNSLLVMQEFSTEKLSTPQIFATSTYFKNLNVSNISRFGLDYKSLESISTSASSEINLNLITKVPIFSETVRKRKGKFMSPSTVSSGSHSTLPFAVLKTAANFFEPVAAAQNISSTSAIPIVVDRPNHGSNRMRYFLSFESLDCPSLKAETLDSEILKALSSLGVLKVSADILKTRCRTKLNVNITATAPRSAILRLEDGKSRNLTVTVFDRTFRIVDIRPVEPKKLKEKNSTSTFIDMVIKNELKTSVAVGTCFGLVFLICVTICCLKCYKNGSRKRLRNLRNNHTPLSPDDYTLTPIPRPTSLYVDYYRNSLTGDLYSTTSAGSVGSTSPTTETGVIQPFDTSIVPLEDSSTTAQDSNVRRDSVESVPEKQRKTSKTQTVTVDGLIYCNAAANSTEKLNPSNSNPPKNAGVYNPTYQRY